MPAVDSVAEVTSLLEKWGKELGSGADAKPVLERIAELVEKETEAYYKMDPDPFDDRHPGRADPTCALGHLLKAILKNDDFMTKLVSDYVVQNRDQTELHTVACRLLLDMLPGLDVSVIFKDSEALIRKLLGFAESNVQPLSTYATGLLAGAMEEQDIAMNFKDANARLVPMMLQRLRVLRDEQQIENSPDAFAHPFAGIGRDLRKTSDSDSELQARADKHRLENGEKSPPAKRLRTESSDKEEKVICSPVPRMILSPSKFGPNIPQKEITVGDCSNSSWADIEPYVIGHYKMHPLTNDMKQRFIVQYLAPLGEYQELLTYMFEHNALELIFHHIDLTKNRDVRLAFETLKYLAALLCNKKFVIGFLQMGGVQKLLQVYRPSVAATGVSMCLYYLSYFEDAMERVCQLPRSVLADLVSYVLWLLECSHESGRCHAIMFFSQSFPFRVILELFDRQDGLRKLVNIISTQEILRTDRDIETFMTEDMTFTARQNVRHVCVALKKYFEAHLGIKADEIRREQTNEYISPVSESSAYKATKYTHQVIQDNIELLLECLPLRMRWDPVSQFNRLSAVPLLIQLVAIVVDWPPYNGKADTIKSALETLAMCSVMPKTQMVFCESVQLNGEDGGQVQTPSISIILGLAESDVLTLDPDVQKAALHIINNLVCGPHSRGIGRIVPGMSKKKSTGKGGEDLLSRMWGLVRANNGIMVLLKLLSIKTPITEADEIRALACKGLVGLVRSDNVKQIISKLPLFNNYQLQNLMREPVLQDKRLEHVKFCKYASALIETVSGKTQNSTIDASLEKIRKDDVVAQTKIIYQEKELLQLIHSHLSAKGLSKTASMLQQEAELPKCSTPPPPSIPSSLHLYSPVTPKFNRQISNATSVHPTSNLMNGSPSGQGIASMTQPARTLPVSPGTPLGPIRVNIVNNRTNSPQTTRHNRRISKSRGDQPSTSGVAVGLHNKAPVVSEPAASLDKIVTEYLRKQHALCGNPVVTCPPFSLLEPHRCPEPKHRNCAPTNFTSRHFQKHLSPPFGGSDGARCDRKYIYSRFRPIRSYRDAGEDHSHFTSCAFSSCESYLMLGTESGELKLFNLQTAEESVSYSCHNTAVTHVEPSKDGKLVLTCGDYDTPASALWTMTDLFEMKHSFEEDSYVEFSKVNQDLIVGTNRETATLYDTETGRSVVKLYDQDKANNYLQNRATFSPSDDLVLNDGVLWDVNSGKPVHKFDKFNSTISGLFHPNGLEIIINSEVGTHLGQKPCNGAFTLPNTETEIDTDSYKMGIKLKGNLCWWDMRSYHLLYTVPALDQCQLRFNNRGDVIYGAISQFDDDEDEDEKPSKKSPFGSSFRTFDGTDYSNIATIDVKKSIFGLCTDSSDCYLAVIENQIPEDYTADEVDSMCRLYEVGRLKDEDDQDQEEEEDLEDDDDDGEDDSDDAENSSSDSNSGDNQGSDADDENEEFEGDTDDSESDTDDGDDADFDDIYFELSEDASNL